MQARESGRILLTPGSDYRAGMTSPAPESFAGRVALVTGAGSGIGRATAELLARQGARVALLSRTPDEIEEVRDAITQAGGEAICLKADVSQSHAVASAVKHIDDTWQRLDILVANAGINGTWAPITELRDEDWDKTISINLRGTFLCAKHSVPLIGRQGGAIVIVSSVNGTRMFSNSGASAYATSKAGQVAFGRMLALELATRRIRVNTVCPGAITTSIEDNTERENLEHIRPPVEFPEGRIPLTEGAPGTAEQVAQLISFLASDSAGHITGTEVFIDGAQSLLQG